MLDTARAMAALWCPTDGYLQPSSLVTANARAARDRGVRSRRILPSPGSASARGAITGIRTGRRAVATDMVINAAGPWAGTVARLAGQDLPVVPVRHEYFVTGAVAGWHGSLPVLRIPDLRLTSGPKGRGSCAAAGNRTG